MNNIYNDLNEISKEAREEFQEYNRQGPQYGVGVFETALHTWCACKSYQEYKQSLKENK